MTNTFSKWIEALISEKEINTDQIITVEGASGSNIMPLSAVIDAIKNANTNEQQQIKSMLTRLDFANAPIVPFFKHLAQAIAI